MPEERGFVRTTLINAVMTGGAVLVTVAAFTSGSVFAALDHIAVGLTPIVTTLIKIVSWALTATISVVSRPVKPSLAVDALSVHRQYHARSHDQSIVDVWLTGWAEHVL